MGIWTPKNSKKARETKNNRRQGIFLLLQNLLVRLVDHVRVLEWREE